MQVICKEECRVQKNSPESKGWSLFTSLLALFMPKCAFCWAAYMSIFSSVGLVITYQPWFLPLSIILFLLTLIKLLVAAIRTKNFIALSLALLAGLMIFSQRNTPGIDAMKVVSISVMTLAIMHDNFLLLYQRLKSFGHFFAFGYQRSAISGPKPDKPSC